MDPEYVAVVPKMEEEEEQSGNNKFLGKHCEFCMKCGETYCWCNSSDWQEGLLNVKKPNANPSIEKTPSPTIRTPPAEWAEQRNIVVLAAREKRQNMEIETARSLSLEGFHTTSNNSRH